MRTLGIFFGLILFSPFGVAASRWNIHREELKKKGQATGNIFHDTAFNPRIGVLLINLGSPRAPTSKALWWYLREFLSDRRIIEIPRWQWYPVLYGVILPFRASASAAKYKSIWTDLGSPLVYYSRRQSEKLEGLLRNKYDAQGDKIYVKWAMRYGEPTISKALREFKELGIRKLVIIPLYPQPAAATTSSAFDKVFEELGRWRLLPEIRLSTGYADHPAYIKAISNSIKQFWEENGRGDRLVISYHGSPEDLLQKGDPYSCFCRKTTRLVTEELCLENEEYEHVYQSRFGPAEWLKPYCDEKLAELSRNESIKKVDVVCPGFSSDCLETEEEVKREYKETFELSCKQNRVSESGELRYIRCLNDSEEGMKMLLKVVEDHLVGWVKPSKT